MKTKEYFSVLRRQWAMKYCHLQPSERVLSMFSHRQNGEITSLELLSIALVHGNNVILWSDNTGAERMTAK
eukprot:12350882-Karenia_brevis.AAC.1